jgi:hypothetical protein
LSRLGLPWLRRRARNIVLCDRARWHEHTRQLPPHRRADPAPCSFPAARLAAVRPETQLPDDSCTGHRPTTVDGHLAALWRAARGKETIMCSMPEMM